jgi:hypothetical protein
MFLEYGDTATGESENPETSDKPADDLGWAIVDAKRDCETENERLKFEQILKDPKKLLYPNCKDGQENLGSTMELLK